MGRGERNEAPGGKEPIAWKGDSWVGVGALCPPGLVILALSKLRAGVMEEMQTAATSLLIQIF